MNNKNKRILIFLLVVQVFLIVVYTFSLIVLQHNSFKNLLKPTFLDSLNPVIIYGPLLFITIISLLPQIKLVIKRKTLSQDGEILPSFFVVISLNTLVIIEEMLSVFGVTFSHPEAFLIFERFCTFSSALFFLLTVIRYYGFSSPHIQRYYIFSLLTSLLVSLLTPYSNYQGKLVVNTSHYEIYFQLGVLLIYVISIITLIIMIIKNPVPITLKRGIALILMAIGIFFVQFNTFATALLSVAFYTIGSILLINIVGDSY